MLRLIGIILLCLSTLVGPAVHASAMASNTPVKPVHGIPACGDFDAPAASAPADCMPASQEKAQSQRCQHGIASSANRPSFQKAQTGSTEGRGKYPMLRGIDVVPPHGPPRPILADTFA